MSEIIADESQSLLRSASEPGQEDTLLRAVNAAENNTNANELVQALADGSEEVEEALVTIENTAYAATAETALEGGGTIAEAYQTADTALTVTVGTGTGL